MRFELFPFGALLKKSPFKCRYRLGTFCSKEDTAFGSEPSQKAIKLVRFPRIFRHKQIQLQVPICWPRLNSSINVPELFGRASNCTHWVLPRESMFFAILSGSAKTICAICSANFAAFFFGRERDAKACARCNFPDKRRHSRFAESYLLNGLPAECWTIPGNGSPAEQK